MTSSDFDQRAQSLLHALTNNPSASLRDGQLEAIRALALDRRRVLVVQRTGWGKSAVYFIATKLLRDAGAGPTLLLSPLLALMRNQIEAAERMGLRAATINSANLDDWHGIHEQLDRNEIDLLLISPERLANPAFRHDVLPSAASQSGLLVVDEAHCISDWGHDFRPDYRRVVGILELLPPGLPVLCCTATANDRVVADVEAQLGTDLLTLRGPLGRDGLSLEVVEIPSAAERLAWLARFVDEIDGSGIVYCLTVDDTERVAAWLRRSGVKASAYSGQTESSSREPLEQALLSNELKVLVATSALGMGFDKPDLAFVVHFQSPGSPIAYYQQVGRAGRRLAASQGVLLCGVEDQDIQDWFIKTAFPPQDIAEQVVELLAGAADPLTLTAIEAVVNIKHTRLEIMLKVLEVEGAVERLPKGWRRSSEPWHYDRDRVDAVTATRRAEQVSMRDYATTNECRMALLRGFLDDADRSSCGICDNCAAPRFAFELAPTDIDAAHDHLRQGSLTIEPRKKWPFGVSGERRGNIAVSSRVEPGRALCRWGDGGWGALVRHDREAEPTSHDSVFSAALVTASLQAISQWQPDPAPQWVTFVPSLRHAASVRDLAQRLADGLGIDLVAAVDCVDDHAPQAEMANSAQQVRNISGSFAVNGLARSTPVLLVDDTIDSRWTMTEVGRRLRQAGVDAVHPFALATQSGG